MSKTFRCCRTALLVLAAILVVTGTALAQHTTGLPTTKTCPPTAASGTTYECSYLVSNADDQHGIANLMVTETAPIGGTPVPIDCLQPACSASPCAGSPVTSLGVAGSPTASCGNIITVTALQNCSGTNQFNSDNIHASGTDADTGVFNGLPVSADAPNQTVVPPLVCDDGLFCTDDTCSTVDGCHFDPHPCASDGLACNGPETCDETAGACVSGPAVICASDNNVCNGPETCAEPTGTCVSGPPLVCDDGLFCTDDSCDPALGCQTTAHSCDDSLLCTTDTCTEDNGGACVNTPVVCDDSNACTNDSCDPATGSATVCLTTPVVCDDGLFCTDDSCDPTAGCQTTAHSCDDSLNCTTDSCDEGADTCINAPVVCTPDSDLCTVEACNPANGACESGAPLTCASNGLACDGPEACNPATGGCESGPAVVCQSDGNVCNGPEACTEPTGTCQSGPSLVCDDGLFCTIDSCDPAAGCQTTARVCDDDDICTDDSCDEDANQCSFALDTTNDPSCAPGTPGRMTGGGSVFTKAGGRVTHGFELHCDVEIGPNNLEINWGGGNNFHLTELVTAVCTDDPAIAPRPPSADFDTFVGTGTGRCNGVEGAQITFTMTDAGEPGKKDFANFEITGCPDGLTLSVSGNLNKGNQQAHKK